MAGKSNNLLAPLKTFDRKTLVIWVVAILVVTLSLYEGNESFFVKHFGDGYSDPELLKWHKYLYKHICSLVLYFIIPIIAIKAFLKENLKSYGLTLGDWKFGIKATLISWIVVIGPMYIGSKNPEFREFYPLTNLALESAGYFALWGLTYLPHYLGWEFLFRGFIGIGLKEKIGAFQAIMVQVVFTTLLHIGKPEGETWSTIFGGIYLGLLTYRTGSIFWAVLFHFFLGMMNTWFAGLN